MDKITTSIRIDADIEMKAQELFSDLGMDLSTAINIFLKQSIRENAIPFNVCREIPNADTVAALKEAEEIKKHPEQYKRYSSFSEILKEVDTDA